MRIAYFAGSMKPGHDGVTRVLYRMSEYLQEKQINHIFFSAITPPPEEQSVPMHKIPSVNFPLSNEYRVALSGQKQIEEQLEEFRPDILHFQNEEFRSLFCSTDILASVAAGFSLRDILTLYCARKLKLAPTTIFSSALACERTFMARD